MTNPTPCRVEYDLEKFMSEQDDHDRAQELYGGQALDILSEEYMAPDIMKSVSFETTMDNFWDDPCDWIDKATPEGALNFEPLLLKGTDAEIGERVRAAVHAVARDLAECNTERRNEIVWELYRKGE